MKKLETEKGFTLMKMLIVVAIIAILVAIAIPTFGNQMEKAREVTDAANLRAAYAEVMAHYVMNEETKSLEVTASQTRAGWGEAAGTIVIGDVTVAAFAENTTGWTVVVDANGTVTITPSSSSEEDEENANGGNDESVDKNPSAV